MKIDDASWHKNVDGEPVNYFIVYFVLHLAENEILKNEIIESILYNKFIDNFSYFRSHFDNVFDSEIILDKHAKKIEEWYDMGGYYEILEELSYRNRVDLFEGEPNIVDFNYVSGRIKESLHPLLSGVA